MFIRKSHISVLLLMCFLCTLIPINKSFAEYNFSEYRNENFLSIQASNDDNINFQQSFTPDTFDNMGIIDVTPPPRPVKKSSNKGDKGTKLENETLMQNYSIPSLTVTNVSATSMTLNAVFPISGIHGNGVFIQNTATGEWTNIFGSWSATNGSYTVNGLNPGTKYWCQIIWYNDSENSWLERAISVYQTTIAVPEVLHRTDGVNIFLNLESYDTSAFTGSNYTRWINHLDTAYNSYYDLVGAKPYNGQKIEIRSTRSYPGGWAVAGNPVLWYQTWIKQQLLKCNSDDDWSFGILHELGHDFDSVKWNWDAEFMANFKMYYILELLGGKVYMNYMYYYGAQIENYYKTDAQSSYTKTFALGNFHHDALTYCFIRLKNQIGWQPFKDTFRYFNALPANSVPTTNIGKLNLFLTKLGDYSGYDTMSSFSSAEKQIIGNRYGGTMEYVVVTDNLTWPIPSSNQVTLRFGEIDDIYRVKHTGVDIQGTTGDNILSAVNGIVVYVGNKQDGFGNVVYINSVYNGKNIQTRYAHLQDGSIQVGVGNIVNAGTIIGRMGSTGIVLGGSLLHFEFLDSTNGSACRTDGTNTINKDPLLYLPTVSTDVNSYLSNPFAIGKAIGELVSEGMAMYDVSSDEYGVMSEDDPNERYMKNYDLESGEAYLRKLVEKKAWEISRIANYELESRGVLVWNSANGTATVTLNGKQSKVYSAGIGNADLRNSRLVVNIQEFFDYFSSDSKFVDPRNNYINLSVYAKTRIGELKTSWEQGDAVRKEWSQAEATLLGKLDSTYLSHHSSLNLIYFNNSVEALNIIKQYSSTIDSVSQEFGVTREMIAAVLYREITFFNWADATDNIRLKIGISGDASIGLGQILIATGRRTEIDITGSSNYTDDEMRNRLLNDTINIRYVAIVLKSEAKALGISDVMSISRANASKVFARYNAGPYYESPDGVRYGTQTLQYGDAFWRFYQDTDLYK